MFSHSQVESSILYAGGHNEGVLLHELAHVTTPVMRGSRSKHIIHGASFKLTLIRYEKTWRKHKGIRTHRHMVPAPKPKPIMREETPRTTTAWYPTVSYVPSTRRVRWWARVRLMFGLLLGLEKNRNNPYFFLAGVSRTLCEEADKDQGRTRGSSGVACAHLQYDRSGEVPRAGSPRRVWRVLGGRGD